MLFNISSQLYHEQDQEHTLQSCMHIAISFSDFLQSSLKYLYDEVSRNAHNGETNAKKLITRPIMTVTSPNSPHIALTYTKMRFDNFFDQTYPPSWSKCVLCIESGVVFLSGPKSYQNSRTSTAKFY